ncbi:transducin / WD-40 repeat protein family [Cryptosporidium ryanae]|uniref:transducin / WD-40 repeat protein family n=1 Tax=Cryptosporidium ryanae TaxID=515981 RepID=UPI00351A784D|nr:transducin / WD-40 repeat protein family [Cryptosporidium ryanae]
MNYDLNISSGSDIEEASNSQCFQKSQEYEFFNDYNGTIKKKPKLKNQVEQFVCSSTAFDLELNSISKFNNVLDAEKKHDILRNYNTNSDITKGSRVKVQCNSRMTKNGKYIGPWNLQTEECTTKDHNEISNDNNSIYSDTEPYDGEQGVEDIDTIDKNNVSTFLGGEMFDYQNRSWMISPNEIRERIPEDRSYLPKRLYSTIKGHNMGVHSIKYIPITGHLLLSASLDSHIKIWDTVHKHKCVFIYHGHSNAVREIQFASQKRNCRGFYSCGYDKQTILWDIEYGKIKWKNNIGKTPYCIAVHPTIENIIIVGYSNKKAIQYDVRTDKVVQEYSEHLGAVNSITFCENGKRFITTSDDKKMFVWDYGTPIVVKHIADPLMKSMPYTKLHPNGQHLVCQSMDNRILVYDTHSNYRCVKRRFFGLNNTGYAIQCDISPDGQFLVSGDVSGKLHFWDWKTTKLIRSIQAHDSVSIACQWHPTLPSRIATCGWDGVIKIWE